MQIGPEIYYRCPACDNLLKNRSLLSGNTIGAQIFSDGKMNAPMLPDIPYLTKCEKCNALLWTKDLEILKEDYSFGKNLSDEYSDAQQLDFLDLKDLKRALKEETEGGGEKEKLLYLRREIWWKFNDRVRYNPDNDLFKNEEEKHFYKQNCKALLDMLDMKNKDECAMSAELYRNLGEFAACLNLLKALPDDYAKFKKRCQEECNEQNSLVFEIGREKTLVKNEPYFDILLNKNNELLLCISKQERDNDEAQILYDGGSSALLFCSNNYILVLEAIHEGVRKQLAQAKSAIVVELNDDKSSMPSEKNIVREYSAEIEFVARYPDYYEKKYQKRSFSLAEKIEERIEHDSDFAKQLIDYYNIMAEEGNADAQYALGLILRNGKAVEEDYHLGMQWIAKAAEQKHPDAMELYQDDMLNDEDGRYDAYV